MKYKKLRTRILLILTLVSIVFITFLEFYNYKLREKILYDVSIEKLFILTKTIRNFEKTQLNLYKTRFERISKNTAFLKAVEEQDTQKIQSTLEVPTYYYTKSTQSFKHIHIYDISGKLIFDYEHAHMLKSNDVVKQSLLTNKQEVGYVVSDDREESFYSLVFPIEKENKNIGFLEFQVQSDNLFKLASKAGRYKYALYLNEDKKNKTLGKKIASNSKIFDKLNLTQKYIYSVANKNITIRYKDKYYLLHQFDIENYFQKDFLQVIMLSDTTKYIQENNSSIIFAAEVIIVGLFFLLIFLYFILTRLINKLIYDEEQLLINTKQMKVIMDSSDNLIALINHNEIVLANSTLFSFTDFKDLESLVHAHNNLSLFFSDDEGTFVANNASTNIEWIDEIMKLKEEDRVVAIYHRRFGMNYFNVKISVPVDSTHSKIIIFSNITSLYKKSQKDEYMATHDNLTNIYNRQYFNENLMHSIYESSKKDISSSLLMLDLDFFKKVNDTYGHQVGDEVLIKFTQVISENIRDNDFFARWGGEEFVLLLNGVNRENALKIAEHLREKIAHTSFNQAGVITCSIGLSEYKNQDTPESWLSRVDIALYQAKENGRDRVEFI